MPYFKMNNETDYILLIYFIIRDFIRLFIIEKFPINLPENYL